MACVVCQHCQGPVLKREGVAVREGYSYHKKCHKCYVCSETNLLNAEVFKGVIFCCSCSHRIFQGCSTARRTKDLDRSHSRAKSKRRQRGRAQILKGRKPASAKTRPNGVLELTRLAASSDSESSRDKKEQSQLSNTLPVTTVLASRISNDGYVDKSKASKKESTEMGITTDVTQELLLQMNCPVVTDRKRESKPPSPSKSPNENGDSRFNQSVICSDLRIAELGASTEIAHMALRKKSEVPVIIQSESGMKAMESSSLSGLNQDSDVSGESNDKWLKSSYSCKSGDEAHWLDRRIGSMLKMPFKCFKKNILNRSSLISVLTSGEDGSHVLVKKFKRLFHEEVTEHQQRGLRRLYSTINRRRTPYKLGWLNLMAKVSEGIEPPLRIRDRIEQPKRCKHFKRSHSYRCMRAQVMRLAGPTKSELAGFRNKVKKIINPSFVKDVFGNNKKYAIMMSQACGGSDVQEASPRNARSK